MKQRSVLAGFPLLLAFTAPLAAQEPDSALAARVQHLEALVAILQQQMADQASVGVTTRSGLQLELSGMVLVNAFFNNAKVNSSEDPLTVSIPDAPGGLPVSHVGATARQTRLLLDVFDPEVLGAQFTGELDMDFYGGQLAGGRYWPLIRMRRFRADLTWTNAWIMVGEEVPPISELNPSSVAMIGFPEFSGSGNLWIWVPQVRVGVGAGQALKVGIEGSLLAPNDNTTQGVFFTQPDRAERSRRPFVEGRTLIRWSGSSEGEISLGGHYGWIAVTADSLVVSRAVAAAARFTLGPRVEIRAEGFVGQALGVLGGGGVAQSLGPADQPVRTRGGWAQLNLHPAADWEWGGALGFDNPDDADVNPATGRLRNVVWEGHAIWTPGPLLLGVTFRHLATDYPGTVGRRVANHVNVATGFTF